MRLVCLNIWGGKKTDGLKDFIAGAASGTDIFCFQEVIDLPESPSEIMGLRSLRALLPGFEHAFAAMSLSTTPGRPGNVPVGNAIFWKPPLRLSTSGSFFPYGRLEEKVRGTVGETGLLQYAAFDGPAGKLTVANFHGIAVWPKSDTPERLEQSNNIAAFLKGVPEPKILCGDFNLSPDTKSVAIIGDVMANLMERFRVRTTRSRLLADKFPDGGAVDKISDYIFTSPEISAEALSVPTLEISDHLPLILDFEI
ncbi:endonuclease/exonuclease/phosphatase family protein [Patescibacteria group bacterium]|nr:endonuclease/exonuclease/phosphatase family protein [Patescibacteria group bacterium]